MRSKAFLLTTWVGFALGACSPEVSVEPQGPPAALCGNGVVETGEECDDGNTEDRDACRNNCELTVCGDGLLQFGEDCEPTLHDFCNADCTYPDIPPQEPPCGNGMVDPDEDCDPGTGTNTATCDLDCTFVECGDGILNTAAGETCEPTESEDCMIDGQVECSAPPDPPDPCSSHVYLSGIVHDAGNPTASSGPGVSAAWAYGGQLGLAAGNDMCAAIGADHVCTYEEFEAGNANGELATLLSGSPVPAGTRFWAHRVTTTVMFPPGGMPPPGPGSRCQAWTFADDSADGEAVEVLGYTGNQADLKLMFDQNPQVPGSGPNDGVACSTYRAAIACCHPVCH